MTGRWVLSRAGIINVYQYADETIHFAGGRLLLRGVNGSGKSTAMNMLLPFLLDADTRRIDAAGEQSQVLRSWMLSGREEQQPVGYLWIEFTRGDDHVVCGCGIRANRSTDRVTTWWFVTTRRPGIDLALVEGRVPLSVDALRQAIGSHGVYTHDQRAGYRAEVRARLYGGGDLDQHIRLLHVVRNPRVGDRIDVDLPTYLTNALPQLSEAALDDAAQPLEDLEEHRRNVEDLDRTATTLDALATVFQSYARAELRRRAGDALGLVEAATARRRDEADARHRHGEALTTLEGCTAELAGFERDERRLREEISALEASDVYKEGHQLNELRDRVASLGATVADAAAVVATRVERRTIARRSSDGARRDVADDVSSLLAGLSDLAALAIAAGLGARGPDAPGLDVHADHPPAGGITAEITATRDGLAAVRAGAGHRRGDVDEVRRTLDAVDAAELVVRDAERASELARQAVALALSAFTAARDDLDRTSLAWRDALRAWHEEYARFRDQHSLPALDTVDLDGAPTNLAAEREAIAGRLRRAAEAAVDAHRTTHAALTARRGIEQDAVDSAAARVAELAARTLPAAPSLPWRTEGPPPRFAELVEFETSVPPHDRAGLEGALEASGLLTAAVAADGTVVLESGDLFAARGGRGVARSLASVLVVTVPDGDETLVDREAVDRLLAGISIDPADLDHDDDTTVITTDGAFRAGVLRGRHHKPVAEHVGLTARREALERARAEATTRLAEATAVVAATDQELALCELWIGQAEGLRATVPPIDEVARAATSVLVTEEALGRARDGSVESDRRRAAAERDHGEAVDASRRIAATLGLPPERDALAAVTQRLAEIGAACDRIDGGLSALARAVDRWRSDHATWERAVVDVAAATAAHERLQLEHEPLAMRLATLEDTIGLAYAEIIASIQHSRHDLDTAERGLRAVRQAQLAATGQVAAAAEILDEAGRRRSHADLAAVGTLPDLRTTLAVPGLVAGALGPVVDADQDADAAGVRPMSFPTVAETPDGVRQLADAVLAAVPAPGPGPATADGVRNSIRQRRDALGAGWDAEDHQPVETVPLAIDVTGPLGRMPLPDAAHHVRAQLRQLTSLLSAKQDQALRNLLQGLIAKEVAEKLYAAGELITRMNARLDTVTTSHGIGVSLRWRRRDDLDEDLTTTIDLLARPPDLRTAEQDQRLALALSERIADARRIDPEAPYRDLVATVLDYREWHRLSLILRRPGRSDETLTRRTALSEGEKKMVSYLPLFAAVAASCDAFAELAPDVPRFVLLDDAFAKVSEDNHAKLFGLLVELDLDFIATSERLWGTHASVPELAITEVIRDAGLGVIVLEHSRWDGTQRTTTP